jgi:uncharacterized protein (TIGR00251 family)
MAWLVMDREGRALLTLAVQPGAKRNEIVGLHGDALKLKLAAPPVDGKANAALMDFVAARLQAPRRALCLKSGETSRRKILCVEGLTLAFIRARLLPVPDVDSPGCPV